MGVGARMEGRDAGVGYEMAKIRKEHLVRGRVI